VARSHATDLRATAEHELVVEIDGDAATLVAALQEQGLAAVANGQVVTVALEGDVVHDVVRDVIAELDLPRRRMEQRRATLEEVFLASSH
jgi:hypothetical protein